MQKSSINQWVRGLARESAAKYIGIGTTFFDQLVAEGIFPPPVKIGGRKVWDVRDLDDSFEALKDADKQNVPNPWDS